MKYFPKSMTSTAQKLKKIIIILLYKIFSHKQVRDIVVLYSPSNNKLAGNLLCIKNEIKEKKVYIFLNKPNILKFIYYVAISKIVITDDYCPILYPIKFRSKTKFIQVWHAEGAFKKVGFTRMGLVGGPNEKSITHKNYTDVVVSSTNIVSEYSKAFKIDEKNIKPLGSPRTDLFFDKDKLDKSKKEFLNKYPMCKDKKVILYAPTFRGNGIKSAYTDTSLIDLDYVVKSLDNSILLVKAHPFSKNKFDIKNSSIIDITDIENVNDILPSVDILVTDYSSIIFDALLLNINIVLYAKDRKKYESTRGFYESLEDYNFGLIANTEDELINCIKNPVFNKEKAKEIKEKQLNMCDGLSTKRFIDTYLK